MLTGFGRGGRIALRVHVVDAPHLTPAFAIKTSLHQKNLQTSRLWAMGEHYIERWLSYDPITEQHAVHQRRGASRGSSLFSSGLMIYAPTPALAGV